MSSKLNSDEKRSRILILLGDPSGVGPELVAKNLPKQSFDAIQGIILGDERVLKQGMEIAKTSFSYRKVESMEEISQEDNLCLLDLKNADPTQYEMGKSSAYAGRATAEMLLKAMEILKNKQADGMCFAPLNKGNIKLAGYHYESEHALFSEHLGTHVSEINYVQELWSSRVTSHVPLREVCNHLTKEGITESILLLSSTMEKAGVERKIAVAALNPHAGEHGLCGDEEETLIIPAIEQAEKLGVKVMAMEPADVVFRKAVDGIYNGIVTMYHDQGQVALKLRDYRHAVTIAAGDIPPITTPAHGTAYDIAGKGIATDETFQAAYQMCISMIQKRK